jgi:hypothetical protein
MEMGTKEEMLPGSKNLFVAAPIAACPLYGLAQIEFIS